MDKFLQIIINFFKALFKQNKIEEPVKKPQPVVVLGVISHIPKLYDHSKAVGIVQKALKVKGYSIKVDNDFGPKTEEVVRRFQRDHGMKGSGVMGPRTIKALGLKVFTNKPKPTPTTGADLKAPWFWKLKKYEGNHESSTSFQKEMNPYWKKAGLPSFKGLVGSKRAWCALFIVAGLSMAGHSYKNGNAMAKSFDKVGQSVNWKSNGFWQGSIIRINSKGDCKRASGNHVTMANGDCTAKDLLKSGAKFSGYGGNQGNMAKVSTYSVRKICAVRWPTGSKLPGKVNKSINCSNGKTDDNESTR